MSQTRFESRAGRTVVLKPLDEDCLLDDVLHPSIRLRLERVRELPVTAVANLQGVERIDGRPFLVWDFVDGATLAIAVADLNSERRASMRREILLAVESLHTAGVVHGAIHERNIVVGPRGEFRLTHVSPLLYDDPQVDEDALAAMFDRIGFSRTRSEDPSDHDARVRVRAIVAASIALLGGIVVALLIGWYARGAS